MVGSDVESAVWDSNSYCGGYAANVGLEFTQNWLSSCSDGFLECSSQKAAGTTWFTDKQRTQGADPLGQMRREGDDHDDPFHPAGQRGAGGAVPLQRRLRSR